MRYTVAAAPLALAVLAFAAVSHAQEAPPGDDPGARARIGVDGSMAVLVGHHLASGGLLGVGLEAGLQINDRFAIYLHGNATTLALVNFVNASLLFEYGPTPWLTISLGPVIDGGIQPAFLFSSEQSETDVGGALVVGFSGLHRGRSGHRAGWRFTIEFDTGYSVDEPNAGGAASAVLGLGWVLM